MDTSRRARRLGIVCLMGLLVTIITVPPHTGYTARLATEEAPTKKAAPRGTAPDGSRERKDAAERAISFNLRNADLVQVINLISELTGKSFLVDDKVRGKVTIIAPTEVTLEEAYQIFLSVLEIQGFTIVPQGPIIKIVPSRDVKDNPIPTATDGQHPFSPATESFVTQLVPLQYADANDIRGLLTPLVSKESSLLAYAPTNSLIVTDTVSNINRLLKIITALDVEAPSMMFKVVMLKFAQAEQIATALRTAVEGLTGAGGPDSGTGAPTGAEGAPPPAVQPAARGRRPVQASASAGQRNQRGPRIVPDPRTNSLVLIATRADMVTLDDLIAKLDIRTPEGRGQIHVYYLQYANAEELAQVLTAQAGEITRTLNPTTSPPGQSTTPGGLPPTTPGGLPPTTSTLGTPTTRRQGVIGGTTPSGVSIVADKPTNSLVITAPPEAYALLKEIIQKLDVRRSQVLVESLIAEVTLTKAQSLGVEWRAINAPNGTQVFASSTGSAQTGLLNATLGAVSGGGTAASTNPLAGFTSLASQGFLIGLLRTITITPDPSNPNSTVQLLNIPLLLRAFQGDSDVNILSTPNLVTTDNEEAEIVIGEQRPFLRSAQDTPVGGVTTSTSTIRTFEFKDTGITLRVTPQISQGKTVRLKLAQEVTAFVSEAEVGAVTTTKRSAKTTVIVDDNQTIVIGGLISNDSNEAKTSVPCLGNIPILGWAFKQTSASKRKTNLLIFLTPHIITSPEDIDRVTTHERQRIEQAPAVEEQLRQGQPQDNLELLLN
jgi:general secretion pathway protein D